MADQTQLLREALRAMLSAYGNTDTPAQGAARAKARLALVGQQTEREERAEHTDVGS